MLILKELEGEIGGQGQHGTGRSEMIPLEDTGPSCLRIKLGGP